MAEQFDMVTVFTDNGRTFSFRDVQFVCDNESVVEFRYSAMSDGRTKTAIFFKSRIVGISKTKSAYCDIP